MTVDTARWTLDASALLALVKGEPGSEQVAAALGASVMSSVNVAETASTLLFEGYRPSHVHGALTSYGFEPVDFDLNQAMETARLRPLTAKQGLSLGDRACLALALLRGLPVLTSDHKWASVDIGVKIIVIR